MNTLNHRNFYAAYTRELYQPTMLSVCVENAIIDLSQHSEEFDSIVVRGTSGTIFGGALSIRIGKPLFVVRKPNEKSHTTDTVSGMGSPLRWLFVDDFVSAGTTLRACLEAVGSEGYVGRYTYNERILVWRDDDGELF